METVNSGPRHTFSKSGTVPSDPEQTASFSDFSKVRGSPPKQSLNLLGKERRKGGAIIPRQKLGTAPALQPYFEAQSILTKR